MSNKQNDLYLEDVARAEEDLQDAKKALSNSEQDLSNAITWNIWREAALEKAEGHLFNLKNKHG